MNKFLIFRGFRNSDYGKDEHTIVAQETLEQLRTICKFIVKQVTKKKFLLYLDDKYKEKKFLLFFFKRIVFYKSWSWRKREHLFDDIKFFSEIIRKIKGTLDEVELRMKNTHDF